MRYYINLWAISCAFLVSCEGTDEVFIPEDNPEECQSSILDQGKYYEQDGKTYLYGGSDTTTHFDISGWALNPCYLDEGLGREFFPAPIEPQYDLLQEVKSEYEDAMEAVLLLTDGAPKVYPLRTLREYEAVNDRVADVPIMVVYCFLADLIAVYHRNYCGEELVFGVSGYTYRDPYRFEGLESFILWDRNTESLWWPINDEAVAGELEGNRLRKFNARSWGRSTIGAIFEKYPDALIIKPGQEVEPPEDLPKVEGCN